jgi:hypothetical protein
MNPETNAIVDQYISDLIILRDNRKDIEEREEQLKVKVKEILEFNGLDFYEDQYENALTLKQQERTTIDKKLLVKLYGEKMLGDVTRVTKFKTLRLLTKADRERMKTFAEKSDSD